MIGALIMVMVNLEKSLNLKNVYFHAWKDLEKYLISKCFFKSHGNLLYSYV